MRRRWKRPTSKRRRPQWPKAVDSPRKASELASYAPRWLQGRLLPAIEWLLAHDRLLIQVQAVAAIGGVLVLFANAETISGVVRGAYAVAFALVLLVCHVDVWLEWRRKAAQRERLARFRAK